LNENKLLVIDIETTGFDHKKDCILELGIVELNLETGEIKELLDVQFKEKHLRGRHRKSWIFEQGYMKPEDVRDAKPMEMHFEEIQSIFNKYQGRICAWNRPFDINFLETRGFKFGKNIKDPMRESADYFQIPNKYGQPGKWPSAQEAWDVLFPGITKIEQHRGLDDAVMESKIIYELVKKGVYLV